MERACQRILGELAGMVRTEIPDFAAFRAAVTEAERGLGAAPDAGGAFLAEDVELLREVSAAGDEPGEVLRLLDRDPVRRLLPFVERIPLVRNGERIWRTPVELSLLRKRPEDPERCERLLDELEKLVRTARLPRAEPARVEVLEAVTRARRDARREGAYMPTSLRSLEAAVEAWLRAAPPEARRRRDDLDALLLGLLRVRGARAGSKDLREVARSQAQTYACAPWLHTPWLTACALANLLDAELLRPAGGGAQPPLGPRRRVALGARRGRLLPLRRRGDHPAPAPAGGAGVLRAQPGLCPVAAEPSSGGRGLTWLIGQAIRRKT